MNDFRYSRTDGFRLQQRLNPFGKLSGVEFGDVGNPVLMPENVAKDSPGFDAVADAERGNARRQGGDDGMQARADEDLQPGDHPFDLLAGVASSVVEENVLFLLRRQRIRAAIP